jgi:hypothetical protein
MLLRSFATSRFATHQASLRSAACAPLFRTTRPILHPRLPDLKAPFKTRHSSQEQKWWNMNIKDFAIAYPFTFCIGTVAFFAVGYYDIKGIGEIMDKYAALQKVMRDSKHLDKVLEEMSATHRSPEDKDEGKSDN